LDISGNFRSVVWNFEQQAALLCRDFSPP